ncbi:MAG: putative lipoprotein [Solirubrobacterales bacterium]|nr:putative lipoprotein [Solirubrobacterales bacterium]
MLVPKHLAPVRDCDGSRARRGSGLARRLGDMRLLALAATALAGVTLAACGSSSKSSSTSSSSSSASSASESSAAKPTGTPIKTFTITTIHAQKVPEYAAVHDTAKAYEKWINSHGGINGHPLEVTVCDDRGEPTQATKCAREGIEAGDVAGVGSFSFFGAAIVPVLQRAGTAWFGIPSVQSAPELESKVSFPTGSIPANGAGIVAKAYEEGCKHVNAIVVEGAGAVFDSIIKNAAKAYGQTVGRFVNLPAEAKDYSPQVAEATGGGADCVIGIIAETQYQAFMPAWAQSGTKAKLYGVQGNLNEHAVKGYEQAAEGSVIGGPFPDISTKPWADMRTALQEYGANKSLDYDSITALGDWNGYTAFAKVVEKMTGPINNKTFLEAASKTTSLSTNGQVPTLDFTKEWTEGPKGFPRLFNRSVAFSKLEKGKVVPVSDKLYDASALMLGTGKLGPGVSP